jgi:hypothetical protein
MSNPVRTPTGANLNKNVFQRMRVTQYGLVTVSSFRQVANVMALSRKLMKRCIMIIVTGKGKL